MSIDGAKALAAKVLTDETLAKQINEAKTEAEFQEVVAKLGYSCTAEEFKAAFTEAQASQPLSDEQLDQVAGGLSIVGVDYAFTATQTARA
ncbi:Nif11-like leader peptide family RiPP precursor [Sporomusa malonica]|uniref:Nif11-like leader peptide domain-containing protein n=1 Tax=Sporomusa malonica TaxID=112901 RepID=A0A1W2CY47_9FIRM|nr:Nif11-like leader peptide family RiPP precursor [Sporomusa malonica]SMC90179.1 nif11-like leader peptide domain-containing protein [Sporomusa malonica]